MSSAPKTPATALSGEPPFNYKRELDYASRLLLLNLKRLEEDMAQGLQVFHDDHTRHASNLGKSLAMIAKEARAWEDRAVDEAATMTPEEQLESLLAVYQEWPPGLQKQFLDALSAS